jgi:G:T-mismatch repair DNA endonuclease (very short patch repair protein)
VDKIVGNQERDRRSNLLLEKAGWTVIRIWECELKKDPNGVKRIIDRIPPKSKHPTESTNTNLLNPKPVSIFPHMVS